MFDHNGDNQSALMVAPVGITVLQLIDALGFGAKGGWVHETFSQRRFYIYLQTSTTRRTVAGNTIVDHLDVVGATPIGAAPTTSSFST